MLDDFWNVKFTNVLLVEEIEPAQVRINLVVKLARHQISMLVRFLKNLVWSNAYFEFLA